MENRAEITAIKTYFQDLRQYPYSDDIDNTEILAAQRGDMEARNDIINKNLRLVVSIAKKYKSSTMSLEDIIQEGNFGLFKAIEKFDVSRGYKFSTYATYWIKQTIGRGMANKARAIRIPERQLEKFNKYKNMYKALTELNNREPTFAEIASALNITESEAMKMYSYMIEPASLETDIDNGEDGSVQLGDLIEDAHSEYTPAAALESIAQQEIINTLLKSLKPQEADIITKRFGLNGGTPMTLEQIGNYYHLTRERIRQVEASAMRKLRNPSRTKMVKEFLS